LKTPCGPAARDFGDGQGGETGASPLLEDIVAARSAGVRAVLKVDSGIAANAVADEVTRRNGFDRKIRLFARGYYFLKPPWWPLIYRNFPLLFPDASF
jgi:hypothetical protein